MSDGITIDVGSAYPYLENRVLGLFGKDACSSEWAKVIKNLVRTSNEESETIQCPGMSKPIPIADLYQPTHLVPKSDGVTEEVNFDDLVREKSDAIIFAGAGWGKTTLLHWIYQRTATSHEIVPLLFTLRRPDVFITFEKFVEQLEAGRVIKKRSTILVLVDGYDEIDTKRRTRVSALLARYRSLGLGPFFLTCRTFYDVYDLRAPHFKLSPFSESDALRFIAAFSKAYRGPRIEARDVLTELTAHGLDEFARHPLMLALVCILRTGPNSSIPRTAIALIKRAIDTLTLRWDQAKHINRSSTLPIDGEERVRCLMRIAYDMKSLQGSWMDVERSIAQHMLLLQTKGIDKRILLQEIMQWYGLIVPAGEESYQFVHRSIHDFLAARFWVEGGTFGRTAPDEWDMRAAYATCLIPDGTTQLQRMLRSGDAAFGAFRECLYNNALFDMQSVAEGVIERTARKGYTVNEEGDVIRAGVSERFFSVAKDGFLEVLIEVGSKRRTVPGDAIAFCSLAELYIRRKKIERNRLYGRLKTQFADEPKRLIIVQKSRPIERAEDVARFRLSDVVG